MTSGESPFTLFPWCWLVEGCNEVSRWFDVGIKAGTQPKQQDRLVISSRDAWNYYYSWRTAECL